MFGIVLSCSGDESRRQDAEHKKRESDVSDSLLGTLWGPPDRVTSRRGCTRSGDLSSQLRAHTQGQCVLRESTGLSYPVCVRSPERRGCTPLTMIWTSWSRDPPRKTRFVRPRGRTSRPPRRTHRRGGPMGVTLTGDPPSRVPPWREAPAS